MKLLEFVKEKTGLVEVVIVLLAQYQILEQTRLQHSIYSLSLD
jgi:hypothetical protein